MKSFLYVKKVQSAIVILAIGIFFLNAELINAQQNTVTTSPPLISNNGQSGISFNVGSKAVVKIVGFANTFNTGSQNFTLWYNTDSINGTPNISTSSGWVQHESGTAVGNNSTPVSVTLNNPLTIPAGETYGFFIETGTRYQTSASGPWVFSDGTLHINTGSSVGYGGGPPTPTFHIRQFLGSITYELTLKGTNNSGVSSIDSPSNFCFGTHNVVATIENSGSNLIDSVRVNWTVNGISQGHINYNGKLDTIGGMGNHTAQVVLGSLNFAFGQPYDIRVWTSHPNGMTDTINDNDTIQNTLMASLSGNFTIGKSGSADYTSFDSALVDLINFGICGPVYFTAEPGTYNEQVTIPEIAGASAINTITFDGKNVVTISHSGSSSDRITLLFDGADHVTFKNMDIVAAGASYGYAVLFTNQANYNTLDSLNISTNISSTSSNFQGIISSASTTSYSSYGDNANYTVIQNCHVTGGYYSLRFNGSGSSLFNLGNQFLNNTFEDYYYYGSYFYYQGDLNYSGNRVFSNRGNQNSDGLYCYYSSDYIIDGNHIVAEDYGMYIYRTNYYNSTKQAQISNNMVESLGDYAMYVYYPEDLGIYHNTTRGTQGLRVYYAQFGLDVRNNIFLGITNAFYSNQTGGFSYLDYNIYHSEGSILAEMGGSHSNLSAWQTALPGFNLNSLEVLPLFAGPDDFHVEGPYAYKQGDSVGVMVDFDGDTRDLNNPDIGADEYTLPPIDLATVALSNPETRCQLTDIEKVEIYITFMGTDTLHPGQTFDVSYQINGGAVITETVTLTGSLVVLDSLYYAFNTFADLSVYGEYEFRIWHSISTDGKSSNDTLTISVFNSLVTNFPYVEDFESFGPLSSTMSCQNNIDGMSNGWEQEEEDGGNWNVWAGPTPDLNTGPIVDFNPGTYEGKYLATISTTSACNGYEYMILTPCFDLNSLNNPGMNFAYNMWGPQMGSLHVDIVTDTGVIQNIWSRSGNQGAPWKRTAVSLKQYKYLGTVKFRFRSAPYYYDSDIAIDDFRLGELPVVDSDTVNGCGSVTLNAGNPGSVYEWSTGGTGQTEIIIAGDQKKEFTVNVSVTNHNGQGLTNWGTKTVILEPGPYVNFGSDSLLICDKTFITLDAGNPGMNYLWSTNESTQDIQVNTDGLYHVTVTDDDNCTHADTVYLDFEESPLAAFTVDDDIYSYVVKFNSSGSIGANYFWDFGDGTHSTAQNPTHQFNSEGYFIVTLVASNRCGSDTLMQEVYNEVRGVGVDFVTSLSKLGIFPNPSNGKFILEIETEEATNLEITIIDVQGRKIDQSMLKNIFGQYRKMYDLNLASGIYYIQVHTGEDVITKKLVIQ